MLTPAVNRTLHTYHSVLRIMCQAFQIETHGRDFKYEKRITEETHKQNTRGKMLAPITDDAHLMKTDALRRLRLMFEDFPKSHNLVLVGQPQLLYTLSLTVNEDIRGRVIYSTTLPKLAPDDMHTWVLHELDRVALAHRVFTTGALELIVRSGEGVLRRTWVFRWTWAAVPI